MATRTNDGANEEKNPPSAHTATFNGIASHNARRACGGTCRVGASDFKAPGMRLTVSGRRQIYRACNTIKASRV